MSSFHKSPEEKYREGIRATWGGIVVGIGGLILAGDARWIFLLILIISIIMSIFFVKPPHKK